MSDSFARVYKFATLESTMGMRAIHESPIRIAPERRFMSPLIVVLFVIFIVVVVIVIPAFDVGFPAVVVFAESDATDVVVATLAVTVVVVVVLQMTLVSAGSVDGVASPTHVCNVDVYALVQERHPAEDQLVMQSNLQLFAP